MTDLIEISERLDEIVRDAEDFIIEMSKGVEASVRVCDQTTETHLALRSATAHGKWRLVWEVNGIQTPVVMVSRDRKCTALELLPSLLSAIEEEKAFVSSHVLSTIESAVSFMARARQSNERNTR